MLPFALKIIWFFLSILGTVCSWIVLMVFGISLGSRWVNISFGFALTVLQGMFCLGMIWRMNPSSMPPAFCLAQTIVMEIATYVLAGLSMAFCIATSLHILKPKTWGNLEQSITWRPIYIIPVVVYPLLNSALQITLNLKFDAVRASDDMHCDASDPLWVRLIAHTVPALCLLPPTVYFSVISITRVVRTLRHFDRSRRDSTDPRQARRSEHTSYKPTDPSSPSANAASFEHTTAAPLGFHLPFLRQLQAISHTLAPPSPSPSQHPSLGVSEDGRTSVASSSFPTFAPVVDKPTLYARHRPEEDDIPDVDVRDAWIGLDGDSCAPTASNEGHETPQQLKLDVKAQDEDEEGTFRLSYREHTSTPSRVSHLAHVPVCTPQIQRLLFFQVYTPPLSFPSRSAYLCPQVFCLDARVQLPLEHYRRGTKPQGAHAVRDPPRRAPPRCMGACAGVRCVPSWSVSCKI
ncbi:hypothetical protein B0H17DRAFT_1056009 [Mycena rosella]|uniref:Uncharacterized protein n=1 Tax=Mycena rosella TaxID=1033263 RepID=A0AAD7DMS8_MYCRO|nr:hypothetical protein B0H17DRAFT_1056009 [Mycena rosella]